jgi:hypothetical protein
MSIGQGFISLQARGHFLSFEPRTTCVLPDTSPTLGKEKGVSPAFYRFLMETGVRQRLGALSGLEELAIDEPAIGLAEKLLENGLIPQKAAADAIPIAVAARHGVDYLLTWNSRHLANTEIIRQVSHIVDREGFYVPIICTPRELCGEQENEE